MAPASLVVSEDPLLRHAHTHTHTLKFCSWNQVGKGRRGLVGICQSLFRFNEGWDNSHGCGSRIDTPWQMESRPAVHIRMDILIFDPYPHTHTHTRIPFPRFGYPCFLVARSSRQPGETFREAEKRELRARKAEVRTSSRWRAGRFRGILRPPSDLPPTLSDLLLVAKPAIRFLSFLANFSV